MLVWSGNVSLKIGSFTIILFMLFNFSPNYKNTKYFFNIGHVFSFSFLLFSALFCSFLLSFFLQFHYGKNCRVENNIKITYLLQWTAERKLAINRGEKENQMYPKIKRLLSDLIVFTACLTVSYFWFLRYDRFALKTINTDTISFQLHNYGT